MKEFKFSPLTKYCKQCKKLFEKKKSESYKAWELKRFCSCKCGNDSRKGKPFFNSTGIAPWNKGKKGYMSIEGKRHLAEAARKTIANETLEARKKRCANAVKTRKARGNYKGTLGKIKELNARWKGDKASYSSKHKWIQKYWIKTGICDNCGVSPKPYGKRKFGTEWHNKDNKYNREDRGTWLELCKKCHLKFDKQL